MLLKIPVCGEIPPEKVCFFHNGRKVRELHVKLADEKMDRWEYFLIPCKCCRLEVKDEAERRGTRGIQFLEDDALSEVIWEKERPLFHMTPECGKIERICTLDRVCGKWEMILEHSMMSEENGSVYRKYKSRDLIHWDIHNEFVEEESVGAGNVQVFRQLSGFENWGGSVRSVCWFHYGGRLYESAISSEIKDKKFENLLSLPFERKGSKLFPLEETKNLRVWERKWKNISLAASFEEELRFRIVPDRWPDIRIIGPEYRGDDIDGEIFEIKLDMQVNDANEITVSVCGKEICWKRRRKILCSGRNQIPARAENGNLKLHIWIDQSVVEVLVEGKVLLEIYEDDVKKEPVREGIAENIDFKLEKRRRDFLRIRSDTKSAMIKEAVVYGLRGSYTERDAWHIIGKNEPGKKCYASEHFTIYENEVRDRIYGEPPAYVAGKDMIVSPPRVVEEFTWRENGWGDMSRQVCRKTVYRLQVPEKRFPELVTGLPVLDMAYRVAADVFYLCSSREYALPGQEDMWSAGLFQGKGEGFGVWLRDTTHAALRCGSLIDRDTAHRTLRYAVKQGFDNGSDGPAMGAVGVWDYYCATGDISLVYETWTDLLWRIQEAEKRYEPEKQLVYAPQSASNDAFQEPESGGYCLGAEIYYMDAFRSMEKMGVMVGEKPELIAKWRKIADAMQRKIRSEYWNEEKGHFTSGPLGTEAFENGYWETSGMEGALWSRFHIANGEQKKKSLESLKKKAMTEFGIDLFPYRKEKNHFCHASWGVWNAGIAEAACETGDGELVWQLLMQQVRNAIMNKTFYEVVDTETGRAWRWPGQLWHAAGFISCICYGLLGIRYDEYGMRIQPVSQKYVSCIRLKELKFGNGVYDIRIDSSGKKLYLDGKAAELVTPALSGHHRLEYR